MTTRGRRIVERSTGKTVGVAKSAAKAKASARIRNSAYKRKRGKRQTRSERNPVVSVEWVDSSTSTGWERSDNVSRNVDLRCSSVGYLVEKTRARVRISSSIAWDGVKPNEFQSVLTIPRVAIKSMRRVRTR